MVNLLGSNKLPNMFLIKSNCSILWQLKWEEYRFWVISGWKSTRIFISSRQNSFYCFAECLFIKNCVLNIQITQGLFARQIHHVNRSRRKRKGRVSMHWIFFLFTDFLFCFPKIYICNVTGDLFCLYKSQTYLWIPRGLLCEHEYRILLII